MLRCWWTCNVWEGWEPSLRLRLWEVKWNLYQEWGQSCWLTFPCLLRGCQPIKDVLEDRDLSKNSWDPHIGANLTHYLCLSSIWSNIIVTITLTLQKWPENLPRVGMLGTHNSVGHWTFYNKTFSSSFLLVRSIE